MLLSSKHSIKLVEQFAATQRAKELAKNGRSGTPRPNFTNINGKQTNILSWEITDLVSVSTSNSSESTIDVKRQQYERRRRDDSIQMIDNTIKKVESHILSLQTLMSINLELAKQNYRQCSESQPPKPQTLAWIAMERVNATKVHIEQAKNVLIGLTELLEHVENEVTIAVHIENDIRQVLHVLETPAKTIQKYSHQELLDQLQQHISSADDEGNLDIVDTEQDAKINKIQVLGKQRSSRYNMFPIFGQEKRVTFK